MSEFEDAVKQIKELQAAGKFRVVKDEPLFVSINDEVYPMTGKSRFVWDKAVEVMKVENEKEIRRLAKIVVEEALKEHIEENTKMGYILAGVWVFLQIAIASVVLYLS